MTFKVLVRNDGYEVAVPDDHWAVTHPDYKVKKGRKKNVVENEPATAKPAAKDEAGDE